MNPIILKDHEAGIRKYNEYKYIVNFYVNFNKYGEWDKKYYILLHWLWIGEPLLDSIDMEIKWNYSRKEI